MALVRLARVWISDPSVAEEVVQDTWLSVFQGIHAFEGRSPLQSWICSILANKAKRRSARENRSRPFSAYSTKTQAGSEDAMDPSYFFPAGHAGAGHWNFPVADVEQLPDSRVLADEASEVIMSKIDELPAHYRGVSLLRDLHGVSTEETRTMLGISANNQRVMLHRARTRLRLALEPYLRGDDHVG